MYDRLLSMGRFADRPVMAGAQPEPLPEHVFGTPVLGRKKRSVGGNR